MRSAIREEECTVSRDEEDGPPPGREWGAGGAGRNIRQSYKEEIIFESRAWEKLNLAIKIFEQQTK